MKNILTVSFCLFAAVAAFAEDYEVTVSLGETNRIDAAFVSALGSKNLVKKGRGVLWGSSAMANYTGNITVEEGALMVSGNGDVGKDDANRIVEIRDGATLIVNSGADVEGSAAAGKIVYLIQFKFAGTGDAQWGAALYQVPGGYSQTAFFKSSVILTDDTLFYLPQNVGIKGGGFTMYGHTLTIRGGFELSQVAANSSEEKPIGDIVVESGYLHFNSSRSGYPTVGDPSGTITVKEGAMLRMYGSLQRPLWKLVLEEGSRFQATGSQTEVAGENAANYNQWDGDVEWNTTTNFNAVTVNGSYLTFNGQVSGVGTIRSDRGTLVFNKPPKTSGGLSLAVTGTKLTMPSVENYYGHAGMLLAHRNDGKYDYIHNNTYTSGTTWSYCANGPGPQLDRSYWQDIKTAETWGSIGHLWNREATNVTWKMFVGCMYESWVYVNGAKVYNNKRDSWGTTYDLTVEAGKNVKVEIYTSNGSVYGGPRTDNDKFKLSNVIAQDPGNGYLFTTDTVDRAAVILENTFKNENFAFGNNCTLDVNGMPMELSDFSGFATVTNATTFKIKGTWSVKAADINAGKTLKVTDGTLSFDNVTVAVDDVDALAHAGAANKYHELCSAKEPITGWPVGTVLKGAKREWKLVLSADGKSAGLQYQPKGLVLVVE